MAERRGLLCFGSFTRDDWALLWQREQAVLTRLANRFEIYYVERFATRQPKPAALVRAVGRRLLTQRKRSGVIDRDGLHLIDPGVGLFHGTRSWRRRNSRTLARAIESAWPRDLRQSVLWIYNPSYLALELLERTAGQWERTVYDCVERFEFNRSYPPDIGEIDREIARHVDVVFADSRTIFEEKKPLNPATHFVPPGLDVERFIWEGVNRTLPDELRWRKKPMLGYHGAWHHAFDDELVTTTLEAITDSRFFFVGPTFGRERQMRKHCPSAVFLGPRDHLRLGRYVNGFDICLIPYRRNALTEGVFPSKFFEYVATGLPIVSTDLPDLREYGEWVALARDRREFVEKVQAASDQPRRAPQLIRPFVERQSWGRRLEQMLDLLRLDPGE